MAPDVREQRLVFGEDAELYDKARAGYPESLVDDVLAFVGVNASQVRALEVGAGTGKATRSFARRGVEIVALEPSAAMAAVARGNCEGFANVRVDVASFEDWPLEAAAFHLASPPSPGTGSTGRSAAPRPPTHSSRAEPSPCSGTGPTGMANPCETTSRSSTDEWSPSFTPGLRGFQG